MDLLKKIRFPFQGLLSFSNKIETDEGNDTIVPTQEPRPSLTPLGRKILFEELKKNRLQQELATNTNNQSS